jgi:hypothetical protein
VNDIVVPLLIAALICAAVIVVARFQRLSIRELNNTPDAALLHFSRRTWTALIVFWIPLGGMFFLCFGRAR